MPESTRISEESEPNNPAQNPWLTDLQDHKISNKFNSVSDFYKQVRVLQKQKQLDAPMPEVPMNTFAQLHLQDSLPLHIELEDFEPEFNTALQNGLRMALGDVFTNAIKDVCGVGKFNDTIVYFCTWHQSSKEVYYMPSWVQSNIIRGLKQERLVASYYQRCLKNAS